MLYKLIHGLVAIPLPPYFRQPLRMSRHSHPLALTQIHTSCNYYKYSFFPPSVVQWNRLPAGVVVLPTLDQFGVAVRSLDHSMPYEHKNIFRNRLNENMSTFAEHITNSDANTCTQERINELTANVTNRINSAAGNLFTKIHKTSSIPKFSHISNLKQDKKIWYDDQCKAKKSFVKAAVRAYNSEHNRENRESVFKARKDYKYFCRKKKMQFQRERCRQMDEIRRKDPRKFWKMFKQKRESPKNDIPLNQSFDHFKNLASNDIDNENDDVEAFLREFDANNEQNEPTSRFEELRRLFGKFV